MLMACDWSFENTVRKAVSYGIKDIINPYNCLLKNANLFEKCKKGTSIF